MFSVISTTIWRDLDFVLVETDDLRTAITPFLTYILITFFILTEFYSFHLRALGKLFRINTFDIFKLSCDRQTFKNRHTTNADENIPSGGSSE